MIFIDKIAWLHVVDGRILCVRSIGKDVWYLPGGKREQGESDLETLVREVEEELSVQIKANEAALFDVFQAQADGKVEGLTVKMTCYTAPFLGTLSPASEIDEIAWLTSKDFEKVSVVSRIIFDELQKRGMLE